MSEQRALSREHTRTLVAAAVTAALVIIVVQQSWAGVPITTDSVLSFVITGVALGSIYGVAAQGLVVTYSTSGVFNFAQGAIGMFMTYVYWQLKVHHALPTYVAMGLTIFVLAPLLGLFIERVLMRRLVGAPLVSQLVVTIGLMLALMGVTASLWNPGKSRQIPRFFGTDGFHIGDTYVPYYRLMVIVTGVIVGIALRFLLRHSRLGLTMRAVVDNRDLTMINGARPARATMTAWALGSSMAAIAGIYLAEELSALDVTTLTLFIVDAFAAGIIARLRSLPMAYVGGLIIGLSFSFQQNFLHWGGRWAFAANAIPAIILFIAVLFVPHGRIAVRSRPRPDRERLPTMRRAMFGFAVLITVALICSAVMSRTHVRDVTLALLTAFIMLSLVPLTGWANQISLAQITLAGCGAFAIVQWGHGGNALDLLIAAAFAVPVGLLMAAPAVRLQGLYLALATMAFARMAEFMFFAQPRVFGATDRLVPPLSLFGVHVSDPFELFGISFPQDAGYLLFVAALFSVVGMLVVWSRQQSLGRRLIAMRDSPSACATVGVNLTFTKLIVFSFSAAIAGLAGALLATFYGSVGTANFQLVVGLPYLLLLVVGGVALVSGAVFGGFALSSFTWLARAFPGSTLLQWFQRIGPGLAGIGIGRNPDGAVVEMSENFRHIGKRRRPRVTEPVVFETKPVVELPPLPARSNTDVPILELSGINVRFGGLQAVRDAHLTLTEGTVTGLIGPNGAGKTTLFNVVTGLQEPVAGEVLFDGHDVTARRPHSLARLGLARTFQRLEIFGSLSVRDNVLMAAETRRRWARDRSCSPEQIADAVIAHVGLESVASVRADTLPTGTARLVELARALATRPRVLLLDEPSSGLSEDETRALAAILRELTASGMAILVVEHDMGFIMDLCTTIVVLDAGEVIAEGTPAEVQTNPRVLEAYLGTSTQREEEKTEAPLVEVRHSHVAANGARSEGSGVAVPAIQLTGVSAGYGGIKALFDVDLTVQRGHVCAVLGPNGAGKSTILKVASGQLKPTSGTVTVAGREIDKVSTDSLVRDGLCVVPEGRGVFPNLTVAENLKMASYAGVPVDEILESSFDRFPVLGSRRRQLAGTLSGGEQQMLSIARALSVKPSILLIDELSMGLAPLIVERLYEVIGQIADEGISLLIVEQFAHEVLKVADVAALLVHGRISCWGTPSEINEVIHSAYIGGGEQQPAREHIGIS
jgi:ABC-type branched-subunit amino acid transport system ATPase component/branched-subunit amino acid ABC-type transport system permease component